MPAETKVLLVDDNPMVLQMLERALAPLARVSAASSAAQALEKISALSPDLIICDYRMPEMDGRQLLENLKGDPATARIPFVLAASRHDLNDRLKPLQESVEDFLEKPFYVEEATLRIKRILYKITLEKLAREASGEGRVRGSLAQMNVIDLLQSLEMGRKTCGLTLSRENEQCRLFFQEGQINHALCGSLIGDEAVYRALTWVEPGGTFAIDFSESSPEQTTTRSTQGLLMEGLRLLDEANRDGE
jgi:CheY-like chemotaxis protein